MAYTSWRGTVGMIKPTRRPGSLEQNIRTLPEGIGVIPVYLNFYGTAEQFKKAYAEYERLIAELAEQEVDVIAAGGEPPFMLLGPKGEAELVRKWEKKWKIPVLSTGRNAAAALKVLGIKNVVIIRATDWDKNRTVARYFEAGGTKCLGAYAIEATWEGISNVSIEQVYEFTKKAVLKHPKCDGIYMMGSIHRALGTADMLEQDLGIPVVAAAALYPWSIQKHLHVRQPVEGYGRLLRELP